MPKQKKSNSTINSKKKSKVGEILKDGDGDKKKNGIKLIIDENTIEHLCNDGKEIKKIFHLADIHISRYEDRHDQYMKVFERLVSEIKKDTNNALIVIVGDVLNEKNVLSPSQLSLAKKFFIMLSDLLPIIVTIGNHDISPHGNTIDSLSPILSNLITRNKIYLLLEDKLYYYNNLIFGLTSLQAHKVTPCIVDDETKIKIGLYHGTIVNTKMENGFEALGLDLFKIDDFRRYYDFVMLGDTHKYVKLDPVTAYPSSLIQQKISESLSDHGVIKWDIINKTSEFIRIKNDWGYVRVKVNKDGIADDDFLGDLPINPIMRIEYDDISITKAEEYAAEFQEKYNAKCELVRNVSNSMDISFGKGKKQIKINDIDENCVVVKLVREFMEDTKDYDKSTTTQVCDKIEDMLKSLEYNYCNTVKKFVIKKLKFNNFFNFGEDENVLDYTKMCGIVGIDGNSYSGKSTVACDVLLYAIFGLCSRGDKFDVVNVDKKNMYTDIEFNVNEDEYRIIRKREIKGSGKKRESNEKMTLYKNGENISKESVDKTNEEIVKIICDYDNLVNVTMMLQRGSTSFIDLCDKDRKSLICGLLKLDVFNDILSVTRTQICQINYFLANLRGKHSSKSKKSNLFDKNKMVNDIKEKINEIKGQYDASKNMTDMLTKDYENNKRIMIEIDIKLKGLSIKNKDIGIIIKSIKRIKRELDEDVEKLKVNVEQLKKYTLELKDSNEEKDEIENKMNGFKDIDNKYKKFQNDKNKEIARLNSELEGLLSKRTPVNKKLGDNVEINYNKEKKRYETLIMRSKEMENNIDELESKIVNYDKPKNLDKRIDMLNELKLQLKTIIDENKKIDTELIKLDKKNTVLKNHKYNPNCEYCLKYPVTLDKIECETRIKELDKLYMNNNNLLDEYNKKIKKNEKYQTIYDKYNNIIEQNDNYNSDIARNRNELIIINKDIELSANKISEYEEYMNIKKQNEIIDNQCSEIKKKICNVNGRKYNEYDEYLNLREEKIKLTERINVLQNNMSVINDDIQKLNDNINKYRADVNLYDCHKSKIVKYENAKREFDETKQELDVSERKLNKQKKEESELSDKLMKLNIELENAEQIVKEYTDKQNEKEILENVIKVIDMGGFIDNILSQTAIPKIESTMNRLLENIVDYRIDMSYNNRRFKINKVKGNKIINIDTLSGAERFIANICFKLALDQFNNYVKPGFIVIDEALNCCDNINIDKIPTLFEYIRSNYKFAMVISHDERIKKLYDISIEVAQSKKGSKIMF